MSIGVPIKLIHEAESHIITIEMKTGEVGKPSHGRPQTHLVIPPRTLASSRARCSGDVWMVRGPGSCRAFYVRRILEGKEAQKTPSSPRGQQTVECPGSLSEDFMEGRHDQ